MQPLTPTKLGRYEIVEEIGKGAMGVVYLARDPLIGRLVALKTFRIGYSVKDAEVEQFRIRFIREAQSAGILSHPNIVTIHDVVERSEDGIAFIAMEYVRGTNLKSLLAEDKPRTLAFVADIVAQIAEALDYAHSFKVIHRDIKPANILITAEHRVKITDFGIARLDTSNLTQEGQLLGTPNYMSPEQILGRDVDHRADIFSLGVVLYEMLTRHKPFQGENLTVVSHRIVYDPFTPPKMYVKDLPPGVEKVLAKTLEKDPSRRYQRGKELADEIRSVAAGQAGSEALNATQSVARSAVVADAAALGETRALPGRGATPTAAAALPSPPISPAEEAGNDTVSLPPITLRPPGSTRRRLFLAGGIAAVLLVVAVALVLLWLHRSAPVPLGVPPPVAPPKVAGQTLQETRVLALLRTGQEKEKAGDWLTALAAYQEVAKLDPNRPGVQKLIEEAQRQTGERSRLDDQEREFNAHLETARQALAQRRFDDASTAASQASALGAGNPAWQAALTEAQEIQAKAQEGKQKQQKALLAAKAARAADEANRTKAAANLPVEPARAVQPAPAPPVEVPHDATLTIAFRSDLKQGTLILYVNGSIAVRESFRFSSVPGSLQREIKVPAGPVPLLLLVTPEGQKARGGKLSGNFPGGSVRRLDVHLPVTGEVSTQLN